MNRENEEQRPVPQTLCGVLQKEPNCKCLVLTVLIYGCLAAITWCRCTNVTKIMVNYTKFPIKSIKHVSSPCDDGYIYIPVAFMGMLYLVYLVECYHSPIRIDLLHAESQDNVLSKLAQLKMAQPRIWWKAVSYHYVRRKRQITRYRNGDNYTTTQVYYERVNTHSATSHYYYDYCGVKDITKELILEAKIPITKITLTKGFAFSNIRSATEFEEARSRFFAEQELIDDYMEMREGLDLGYNVNTMLVAVFGNPWFTNRYIYWCLSALLLSWPLRVIIEYKTQYVDYQVTKLFGVNYDTPTSCEPIHASISQLSQPGSYMLAPSYSEALLMEPATPCNDRQEQRQENWQNQGETNIATDMVPSYSEALLYERAEQCDRRNAMMNNKVTAGCVKNVIAPCNMDDPRRMLSPMTPMPPMPCECHCPCPCHENTNDYDGTKMDKRNFTKIAISKEHLPANTDIADTFESELATLRTTADGRLLPLTNLAPRSINNLQAEASPSKCSSCGRISASTQTINLDIPQPPHVVVKNKSNEDSHALSTEFLSDITTKRDHQIISRDISEPNLKLRSEFTGLLKENRSLRNILEKEEESSKVSKTSFTNIGTNFPYERPYLSERHRSFTASLPPSLTHHRSLSLDEASVSPKNMGAIPKTESRSRITMNPMSNEVCWKLPNSKTYLCLKSILKQNRRNYMLVTANEFQNVAEQNINRDLGYLNNSNRGEKSDCSVQIDNLSDYSRSRKMLNPRRRMPSFDEFISRRNKMFINDQKGESTRTLIFASPIQDVFPGDPFGGKDIVPVRNLRERNVRENNPGNDAIFGQPSRSFDVPDPRCFPTDYTKTPLLPDNTHSLPRAARPSYWHEKELQYLLQNRRLHEPIDVPKRVEETPRAYRRNMSLPSYSGISSERTNRWSTSSNEYDDRLHESHLTNPKHLSNRRRQAAGLSRSLTDRRPKMARVDRNFRRSFTGRVEDYRMENALRANFSIETSL